MKYYCHNISGGEIYIFVFIMGKWASTCLLLFPWAFECDIDSANFIVSCRANFEEYYEEPNSTWRFLKWYVDTRVQSYYHIHLIPSSNGIDGHYHFFFVTYYLPYCLSILLEEGWEVSSTTLNSSQTYRGSSKSTYLVSYFARSTRLLMQHSL